MLSFSRQMLKPFLPQDHLCTCIPPGKSEDFCNMKSARFQSNHRTPTNQVLESRGKDLKTLFNCFSQKKVSKPKKPDVLYQFLSCSFEVDFANFFNRTSKISAVEGVILNVGAMKD